MHVCKLTFMSKQEEIAAYNARVNEAIASAVERGILPKNEREWSSEIKRLMDAFDVSVSVAAIGMVRGKSAKPIMFGTTKHTALAKVLQVNSTWLATGRGSMLAPEPPSEGGFVRPPAANEGQPPSYGMVASVTTAPRAPVLGSERLGVDLHRANTEWSPEELRPFITKKPISQYCKFVPHDDDAMSPYLLRGDMVLVDPKAAAVRGKICLFLHPDGSSLFRFFEPLADGHFEARDAEGRAIDSVRHGIRYAGLHILLQRESD